MELGGFYSRIVLDVMPSREPAGVSHICSQAKLSQWKYMSKSKMPQTSGKVFPHLLRLQVPQQLELQHWSKQASIGKAAVGPMEFFPCPVSDRSLFG